MAKFCNVVGIKCDCHVCELNICVESTERAPDLSSNTLNFVHEQSNRDLKSCDSDTREFEMFGVDEQGKCVLCGDDMNPFDFGVDYSIKYYLGRLI